MERTGHVLVVGGTGMLLDATLDLSASCRVVTAVARSGDRLDDLADRVAVRGGRLVPAPVDYRDSHRLRRALDGRVDDDGVFDLAVCWAHSTAPDAPAIVASRVAGRDTSGGRFFHVLSHEAADPQVAADRRSPVLRANPHVRYRQVVLGEMREGDRRRWLTHEEISDGVLRAIARDTDLVVGQLPSR